MPRDRAIRCVVYVTYPRAPNHSMHHVYSGTSKPTAESFLDDIIERRQLDSSRVIRSRSWFSSLGGRSESIRSILPCSLDECQFIARLGWWMFGRKRPAKNMPVLPRDQYRELVLRAVTESARHVSASERHLNTELELTGVIADDNRKVHDSARESVRESLFDLQEHLSDVLTLAGCDPGDVALNRFHENLVDYLFERHQQHLHDDSYFYMLMTSNDQREVRKQARLRVRHEENADRLLSKLQKSIRDLSKMGSGYLLYVGITETVLIWLYMDDIANLVAVHEAVSSVLSN